MNKWVVIQAKITQTKPVGHKDSNKNILDSYRSNSSHNTTTSNKKSMRQYVMRLLYRLKVKMLISSLRQVTQCCCTVMFRSNSLFTPLYCKIRYEVELDMNHHNHQMKRDRDEMWWRLLTIISLLVNKFHQPLCFAQWQCVKCFSSCSRCVKLMICRRRSIFVQMLYTTSCKPWSSCRVMLTWGRYNVQ